MIAARVDAEPAAVTTRIHPESRQPVATRKARRHLQQDRLWLSAVAESGTRDPEAVASAMDNDTVTE